MVFEFKHKWSRLDLRFITNTRLIRNRKRTSSHYVVHGKKTFIKILNLNEMHLFRCPKHKHILER